MKLHCLDLGAATQRACPGVGVALAGIVVHAVGTGRRQLQAEIARLDVHGVADHRAEFVIDELRREVRPPPPAQASGAPVSLSDYTQARYLLGQWKEIYANSSGKGLVGNSIGGLTFQWSDGWWKFRQEEFLDVHDTNASWANDAYPEDFVEGSNNMNEEWWGVAAKGPTDARGLYNLYPRAAFYALQTAYQLDPYGPEVDLAAIDAHFASIQPAQATLQDAQAADDWGTK